MLHHEAVRPCKKPSLYKSEFDPCACDCLTCHGSAGRSPAAARHLPAQIQTEAASVRHVKAIRDFLQLSGQHGRFEGPDSRNAGLGGCDRHPPTLHLRAGLANKIAELDNRDGIGTADRLPVGKVRRDRSGTSDGQRPDATYVHNSPSQEDLLATPGTADRMHCGCKTGGSGTGTAVVLLWTG